MKIKFKQKFIHLLRVTNSFESIRHASLYNWQSTTAVNGLGQLLTHLSSDLNLSSETFSSVGEAQQEKSNNGLPLAWGYDDSDSLNRERVRSTYLIGHLCFLRCRVIRPSASPPLLQGLSIIKTFLTPPRDAASSVKIESTLPHSRQSTQLLFFHFSCQKVPSQAIDPPR